MYSIASLMEYVRQGNEICQQMAQEVFGGALLQAGPTQKDLLVLLEPGCLYRYQPKTKNKQKQPIVIACGLVIRPYILDLSRERSFISKLLARGYTVYVIDWGYPNEEHQTFGLDYYVNNLLHTFIQAVKEDAGTTNINFLGFSHGGILGVLLEALHPGELATLSLVGSPFDFHTKKDALSGLLRGIDANLMVDTLACVPGVFLNTLLVSLKPFEWLSKEGEIIRMKDKQDYEGGYDSLKIKSWIFDNPDVPGAAFYDYVVGCYQQNLLVENQLKLGDKLVNFKNVTTPILNIYGSEDHIVPKSSSSAIKEYTNSRDYSEHEFEAGPLGLMISRDIMDPMTFLITDFIRDKGAK